MANPIRPTQQQLNELRSNKEAIQGSLKDLDNLLAAGAPPDEIENLRKQYLDTIVKIDKILAVYG